MLIGVLADSHVGESIPELPPGVMSALSGADLIVHAGDITDPSALERLRAIAPVIAVQGDHDRLAGIVLPRDHVLEVEGRRIGITHGRRWKPIEHAAIVATLARGRLTTLGLERSLRRRFGRVDCIIHGHLHLPMRRVVEGVLHFSPGAVYVPEADSGYIWSTLRGRVVRHFRSGLPVERRRPSVGLLEVTPSRLSARWVAVNGPLRPSVGR